MLGLAVDKEAKTLIGMILHSDINIWKEGETQPSQVLRGHHNTVTAVANFKNELIITGDNDGRILSWDPNTGLASRSETNFICKLGISAIASNSKFVYSGCQGKSMQQFTVEDGRLKSVNDAFITKDYSIR